MKLMPRPLLEWTCMRILGLPLLTFSRSHPIPVGFLVAGWGFRIVGILPDAEGIGKAQYYDGQTPAAEWRKGA